MRDVAMRPCSLWWAPVSPVRFGHKVSRQFGNPGWCGGDVPRGGVGTPDGAVATCLEAPPLDVVAPIPG
eukprot:4261245-Amphidinium_carterae.1